MRNLFDYIYYVLYNRCISKKANANFACSSSCTALALFQFYFFYFAIMLVRIWFPGTLPSSLKKYFIIGAFIVLVLLLKLNDRRYEKDGVIEMLNERYQNHPANRWFRWWMVFVLYFVLYLLPVFIAILIKPLI